MIIMFNTYFELASNNNTGGSITFKMAVMISSVAKISFLWPISLLWWLEIFIKVDVITSYAPKITYIVCG